MRRVATIALMALSTVVFAADPVKLTDADDGKTVTLKKGQTLEVTLTSNVSTGFSWSVTSKPRALKQKGKPVIAPASADAGIGAAGTTSFKFVATRKVTGKLILSYARSFEKDKPAEKTFTVVFGGKPKSEKAS